MDIRQLRYVVAIAEEGSLSAAAQRVNVAQPSLSQHIITVEKDLGVTLFNRSPRGMTLTQSGGGERPHYGKDYIIPSTFDPRLISVIPAAVAKAAIDSGVARKSIDDFEIYKDQLKQRLDPTVTIMQAIEKKSEPLYCV